MAMARVMAPCRVAAYALALPLALWLPARAWGAAELKFGTAPALPTLPAITINAHSQTPHATMTNFSVSNTLTTKSGWNITVAGQSGTGKSTVFAQYCPKAKCGSESEGYATGGKTLAANSLTLSSSGASFTGGTGTAPTLQCSSACAVDSATAVKVASAATGAGEGTWTTTGFSATSLTLNVATTLKSLPAEEVYRVNILWTLATGP
jgi:putative surface cell wall-binding protein